MVKVFMDYGEAARELTLQPLEAFVNDTRHDEPVITLRKSVVVGDAEISGKLVNSIDLRDEDIPALLQVVKELFPLRLK